MAASHPDPLQSMTTELSGAPVTVIAFGGLKGRLLMPPFEFFNLMGGSPVNRIFVRDISQTWYLDGVPGLGRNPAEVARSLERVVAEAGGTRLVCLGTSAGGFAAMVFGARMHADRILAFSPQTTVRARHLLRMGDRRWARRYLAANTRLRRTDMDVRPLLSRHDGEVHVHYGTKDPLDERHARRLSALANVRLHAHPRGHRLVKHLRDEGDLATILSEVTSFA